MVKKTDRRKRDIKSKLIAAVCMLLVSTIMMVSSTYAWFTLSTAPEVTGITTTIGSNGNLEIALSPTDGSLTGVKDATLATNEDWTKRNLTWGNLLDLSDEYYNLANLTLSPAVLLANSGVINANPLGTPSYGSDGRISGLITDATMIGGLNEGGTGYISGGQYGVRALGTSSGMSTQQLAFKSNLAAISTYATKATDAASSSMSVNGSALASMLVQHAQAGAGDTNNYATHVPALVALTTALDDSVKNLEEAVRAALLVGATTLEEAEYELAISAINNAADLAALSDLVATYLTGDSATALNGVIDQIEAVKTDVENAQTAATALSGNETVEWADVSPVLNYLMNTSGDIKISGYTIDEIQERMDDLNFMLDLATNCVITLGTDSGVYYDIAEIAGNITASTNAHIDAGSLGSFDLKNVIIKTSFTGTPSLTAMKTGLNTITPAGGGDDAVMDTFYGYVVDLMFRTNAADSKLLLQTEGVQRVYGDSNNEETMGGGATLNFQNISAANVNSVKGLVESIRIVFFDPANSSIYGIAKATSVVTTEIDTGEVDENDEPIYTYTVIGNLELCTYTVDTTNSQVTVGDALADSEDTTYNDGAVLCDLQQNTAKAVSALVYLDGTDVTNADVLYNEDILGALNLQFASSIELDPMDNSELFNGTGESTPASSEATTPATETVAP